MSEQDYEDMIKETFRQFEIEAEVERGEPQIICSLGFKAG